MCTDLIFNESLFASFNCYLSKGSIICKSNSLEFLSLKFFNHNYPCIYLLLFFLVFFFFCILSYSFPDNYIEYLKDSVWKIIKLIFVIQSLMRCFFLVYLKNKLLLFLYVAFAVISIPFLKFTCHSDQWIRICFFFFFGNTFF